MKGMVSTTFGAKIWRSFLDIIHIFFYTCFLYAFCMIKAPFSEFFSFVFMDGDSKDITKIKKSFNIDRRYGGQWVTTFWGWELGGMAYIAFGVTENFNIFNIVGEPWGGYHWVSRCYCAWSLIRFESRI